MDPLSMAASILALLQLTGTLAVYLNDVINASAEQKSLAIEASNLYGLLTSLRFRIEAVRSIDDIWFQQVRLLGLENGPLDQLKKALEEMIEKINLSSRKRDQVKSILMWQWTKSGIDKVLHRMERLKSLINCALTNDLVTLSQAINDGVATLRAKTAQVETRTKKLQTHAEQELQNRLSRWLRVPDPSTNYLAALEKRHPDTGFWLLDSQAFEDWRSSKCSFMWLHGSPGCGKTILSSAVLQNILLFKDSHSETAVGYFFFDFNDAEKQSSKNAVQSLTFQLAQQIDCSSNLEKLYMECEMGTRQPAQNKIESLLRDMITCAKHTFIILDAIDECTDREALFMILGELVHVQGLCTMATSRQEKDIMEQLTPIAKHNIKIENAHVDKDIYVYARDRVAADPKLKKWGPEVQKEIVSVISAKADGMFRWAYCQLVAIRQCIKLSALTKTLSSLPRTLDETYAVIIHNIELSGYLQDAITTFQWLCFSIRPLHLLEIVETLAIQIGDEGGFSCDGRLKDPKDIIVVCSSLITCEIDKIAEELTVKSLNQSEPSEGDNEQATEQQIRLAHFSVKEYLLSERHDYQSNFQVQICHAMMTESCLRYLFHVFNTAPMSKELIDQFPLSRYAAEYWWQHAQKLNGMSEILLELALKLLNDSTLLLSWVKLYDIMAPHLDRMTLVTSDLAHPLFYAVSTGSPELVETLLHQTTDIGGKVGANLDHLLQTASRSDHRKVVRILLDAGANVNSLDWRTVSALWNASHFGREEVVRILLDAGGEINLHKGIYGNALYGAAWSGSESICRILLEAGADFNTRSLALHGVASNHQLGILEMLLESGVDVDARGDFASTPLQTAVAYGQDAKVQKLIAAGADVNAFPGQCGSALANACKVGNGTIMQMLLNAGARFEAHGDQAIGSYLHIAAEFGKEDIVKILLDIGVDVNAQGGRYNNALQAASAKNHEAVVRIFLDAGANVNAQGGRFGSVLQAASSDIEPQIKIQGIPHKILSHKRSDCSINDKLSVSLRISEVTLELFLRPIKDDKGLKSSHGVILEEISGGVDKAILEMLLDAYDNPTEISCKVAQQSALVEGLDFVLGTMIWEDNEVNRDKEIVMMMTSGSGMRYDLDPATGQESYAQALLDVGARVNPSTRQDDFDGPIIFKTSAGLVQSLIENGADVNAPGGIYGSAIQAASRYGRIDIVQLLLEHGADVNIPGGEYGSALQAACASFEDNLDLVQMLLDAGADINANGGQYGTALQAACYRGSGKTMRVLLDKGVDVNLQGGVYGNPLQAMCASPNAREELVRMILDSGADVNVQGGKFGNAVQAVLSKGYRAGLLISEDD